MAAPVTTVVDLGPCRWCEDPQWRHRRGKGGCQEVGCGCDKYGAPKTAPVEPVGIVESDPASPIPGVACERPDDADPGMAVGGFEPAQPGDVVLPVHPTLAEVEAEPEPVDEPEPAPAEMAPDEAAQAAHAEQVAVVDAHLAEPERSSAHRDCGDDCGHCNLFPTPSEPVDEQLERERTDALVAQLTAEVERLRHVDAELGRAQTANDRLSGQLQARLGDLDEARRDAAEASNRVGHARDAARREVAARAELVAEVTRVRADLAEERAEHQATATILARVREELDRANAGRLRAQEQLDEAVQTGVAAASRVLWRYDARQCETCGRRYTAPDVDHEHPLRPVTVLVVRREVAGA